MCLQVWEWKCMMLAGCKNSQKNLIPLTYGAALSIETNLQTA
jgi:hypothetical protein